MLARTESMNRVRIVTISVLCHTQTSTNVLPRERLSMNAKQWGLED